MSTIINKKIKAFTLVEVLIAMAFSAIIVTFAYSLLNNTNKSFRNAHAQFAQVNELLLLQTVLNRDFVNARTVTYKDKNFAIQCIDQKQITYLLTDSSIIREHPFHSDTFRIGAYKDSIQYLFGKPPLLEQITIELLSKDSLQLSVSAFVSYENRVKMNYYYKIKTIPYPYGY